MQRNLLAMLLTALVAATIAAGCGGGGSDQAGDASDSSNVSGDSSGSAGSSEPAEPIATAPMGKAQYLKLANAFCLSKEKERIAAASAYIKKTAGQSGNQLQGLIEDVYAPIMNSMFAGLRGLGAPRGDEAEVESLIVALEQRAEGTEKGALPEAALKQIKRAEIQGQKYGLTDCHG